MLLNEPPRVVNVRHVKHRYIYVGRPMSRDRAGIKHWGNPFTHISNTSKFHIIVKSQGAAVEAFRRWLEGTAWHDVQQARRQWILDNVHTLKGRDLGCWCAPGNCHAYLLLRLANGTAKGFTYESEKEAE
jgi:hypothetical protein